MNSPLLFSRTLLVAAFTLSAASLPAASLTWNNTVNGVWDTTTANWTGTSTTFTSGDDATFGATGVGTVSLGAAVTAGTITFNTAGYTLDTNGNALGASVLAGSSAFTKTGTGLFTLTGNATHTGGVTINGGSLVLDNTGKTGAQNQFSGATGDFTLGASGTLAVKLNGSGTGGSAYVLSRNITGTGTLVLENTNATATREIQLTGVNTGFGGILTLTRTAGGSNTRVLANQMANTTQINVGAGMQFWDNTASGQTVGYTFNIAGTGEGGFGAIRLASGVTYSGNITVNVAGASIASASGIISTISGNISGGALTLGTTSNGSQVILTGTSNSQASTTILGGGSSVIQAGNNTVFGSGTLTQNGSTLSSNSTTSRTFANAYVIGGNIILGNATNNGLLTFSNTVDLGTAVRTINTASGAIFSGVVSGVGGGLTKMGGGDLNLSGLNTYTGGTIVSEGRLTGSTSTAFGTGAVTVASGAQAYVSGAGTVTNNFTLTGTGFVGDVRGALRIGASTLTGTVTLAGAARISGAGNDAAATISGNIGESTVGSALEIGSTNGNNYLQSLTLSGTNTYTGGTTISGSTGNLTTVVAGNNNAFGTGSVTLNGGKLDTGGRTLANNLAVAASGWISFGSNATLTGSITGAAGTLLDISATAASSLYLNGDMSGFAGTVQINNASGNVTSTKSDGTASSNTGSSAAAFVVNNGGTYAFSINRGTFAMGSLSGNGSVNSGYNTGVTSTVSVGALNTDTTFAGTFNNGGTGILAVTKTGTGSLTLTGASTHTGGTAINAGTLVTGHASALGAGAVNVGGGTLRIGNGTVNTVTVAGNLAVASGTLDMAAQSSSVVTLTGAATFALTGGTWKINSTTDQIVLASGGFSLTSGFIDLAGFAGKSVNGTYSLISGTGVSSLTGASFINGDSLKAYSINTAGDLVVTAVPEPSTYGLIGAGALAAAAMVRRRRNRLAV